MLNRTVALSDANCVNSFPSREYFMLDKYHILCKILSSFRNLFQNCEPDRFLSMIILSSLVESFPKHPQSTSVDPLPKIVQKCKKGQRFYR